MFHVVLFIVFVCVAMATLIRFWSVASARFHRWHELAQYQQTDRADEPTTWFEGWFDLRGGHTSNQIVVGVNESGLQLRLTWPSGWGNPAVSIPWNAMSIEGGVVVVDPKTARDEPIAIQLNPDQLAKLLAIRSKAVA